MEHRQGNGHVSGCRDVLIALCKKKVFEILCDSHSLARSNLGQLEGALVRRHVLTSSFRFQMNVALVADDCMATPALYFMLEFQFSLCWRCTKQNRWRVQWLTVYHGPLSDVAPNDV